MGNIYYLSIKRNENLSRSMYAVACNLDKKTLLLANIFFYKQQENILWRENLCWQQKCNMFFEAFLGTDGCVLTWWLLTKVSRPSPGGMCVHNVHITKSVGTNFWGSRGSSINIYCLFILSIFCVCTTFTIYIDLVLHHCV